MKKYRICAVLMAIVVMAGMLVGCGSTKKQSNKAVSKSDKIKIVCSTFPQYDWVKQIVGKQSDKFEITLLLDKGADLHSYQPTAKDVAIIGMADLFIYVGGTSDSWAKDVIAKATNKNLVSINMMDTLGKKAKEEEVIEGMESEDQDHDHESEEIEYDEHVWLSLENAEVFVEEISKQIQKLDQENAKVYKQNTQSYQEKLEALDEKYEDTVEHAKYKAILFGDRFPFRYLVDDYDLKYYAAFVGCSAETEASFKTITYLANKVDQLNLPAILVIENSTEKIAKTIRKNTKKKNQKILVMNSAQSVSKEELSGGITYLEIMEQNLKVLKEALN